MSNTTDPAVNPPGASPSSIPPPPPSQTSQSPSQQQQQQQTTPEDRARYTRYIYNTSIGISLLAPLIMILPPRRLDLHTFGLSIAWCMSTSFIVEQKTGNSLLWHIGARLPSEGNKRRRELEAKKLAEARGEVWVERPRRKGMLSKIFGGDEDGNWIKERERKEREVLESGGGYGELILAQVKEAFGVKKEENSEEEGKEK